MTSRYQRYQGPSSAADYRLRSELDHSKASHSCPRHQGISYSVSRRQGHPICTCRSCRRVLGHRIRSRRTRRDHNRRGSMRQHHTDRRLCVKDTVSERKPARYGTISTTYGSNMGCLQDTFCQGHTPPRPQKLPARTEQPPGRLTEDGALWTIINRMDMVV